MPKKISADIRQLVYRLHDEGQSTKDIYKTLKEQNIDISERTILRISKEERINTNTSLVLSWTEDKEEHEEFNAEKDNLFNESFGHETKEEHKTEDIQDTMQVIKDAIKEETTKVLSALNQDIAHSNDKLDEIIKQTKKNINKPLNMKAKSNRPRDITVNISDMTESDKKTRRDLIVKIRNYIDNFSDHDIINDICGSDLSSFKHDLYERNNSELQNIYEEIQIGLSSSKDYENFLNLFSTSLKISEFISNLILGINLSGLQSEVLEEIDEFTLRQIACELSVSRIISPQQKIFMITIKIILKKVLSNNDLISLNNDIKNKLYTYYKVINGYISRG